MNKSARSSNGPKSFGTSKRTSFVDARDNDIPGPGSHNSTWANKSNPSKWKFGTSSERDSFLQKHRRPNPSPFQYAPNKTKVMNHEGCSFPKSKIENPAQYKEDDGCSVNYKPKPSLTKPTAPKFSFGYQQTVDYSTKVPAPNTYQTDKSSVTAKSQFNKTQNYFTKGERLHPEIKKNPGIAEYEISKKDPMNTTGHVFGSSNRSNQENPEVTGIYYDIATTMNEVGKGLTMSPYYEGIKNKDISEFPAPNHYNPQQLQSTRNIINYVSERSQLFSKQHIKYPSPQKHVTGSDFYKKRKDLSFTKDAKLREKSDNNPGPGTHTIEAELKKTKGYIGRKLKKLPQFVTPGANQYCPNYSYNKSTAQRIINYATDRSDFSKSVTGSVGPGLYETRTKDHAENGKMSQSQKFEKIKNKNPGPGNYQIQDYVGRLPNYYSGMKKLTTSGYSIQALMMAQKTMRRQQRMKEQERKREEEEEQMLRRNQEKEK